MANKVSKTTRKRTKNLKKVKRLVEVILLFKTNYIYVDVILMYNLHIFF